MWVAFRVLKGIMVILVIWFALSGLTCVQQHQQAVVLRFGEVTGRPRGPGLSVAFPFPIDQTLLVDVTAVKRTYDKHWFQVRQGEEGKAIQQLRRSGEGLKPGPGRGRC